MKLWLITLLCQVPVCFHVLNIRDMLVEKFGILSFLPSLHMELVFLWLRLVLKDICVTGRECGWTGLGGLKAPFLPFGFSLLAASCFCQAEGSFTLACNENCSFSCVNSEGI